MDGVEAIFVISVIMLLIMWIWFIILGLRTSRLWTASLIFFFPISPLMFAYRFERKTRHTIYYFLASLVLFISTMLYIQFATIDFFPRFGHKIAMAVPEIDFSSNPKPKPEVKVINLPKPTPIPPPLKDIPDEPSTPSIEIAKVPVHVKTSRYKTISIDSVKNYIGKNVIISTSVVEHRGKLISVTGSQLEIKKFYEGGSTTMGISKSKIEKIEVYL